jgi:hypothetical protein
MGIFADQIANTARLVAGGVAESLSKLGFTSDEVYTKAEKILRSKSYTYSRNVLRLQRIAHVAARRKYHAADLIEELMYDNELRFKDGKGLRPMHLQTADMRMSAFKAKNWDLYAVSVLALVTVVGSTWLAGRFAWRFRNGDLIKANMLLRFTILTSLTLVIRILKLTREAICKILNTAKPTSR